MGLGQRAIHVWQLALHEEDSSVVEACAALLSPVERARADGFRSPSARCRFVCCRSALRVLVHAYGAGKSPAAVVFEEGAFGKPVLAPGDHAPVHFNVSHTLGLGLIALASCGPVGVDVEWIRNMPDEDRLVARCFAAGEQAQLGSLPIMVRSVGFFQGWTRKEAFIKATGEGMSRCLQDFEVSLLPGEPARFIRVPESANLAAWSLHSFEPSPGYTAAVAAPWADSTVTFLEFRSDEW